MVDRTGKKQKRKTGDATPREHVASPLLMGSSKPARGAGNKWHESQQQHRHECHRVLLLGVTLKKERFFAFKTLSIIYCTRRSGYCAIMIRSCYSISIGVEWAINDTRAGSNTVMDAIGIYCLA